MLIKHMQKCAIYGTYLKGDKQVSALHVILGVVFLYAVTPR